MENLKRARDVPECKGSGFNPQNHIFKKNRRRKGKVAPFFAEAWSCSLKEKGSENNVAGLFSPPAYWCSDLAVCREGSSCCCRALQIPGRGWELQIKAHLCISSHRTLKKTDAIWKYCPSGRPIFCPSLMLLLACFLFRSL